MADEEVEVLVELYISWPVLWGVTISCYADGNERNAALFHLLIATVTLVAVASTTGWAKSSYPFFLL